MDKKYLAEIKTRAQEAKAEKQKGNDFDCACLSWAIVLNDLPALLDEVERLTKEIKTGRHMSAPIRLDASSAESFCNAMDVSRLEQENAAKDQQIATLKAEVERLTDIEKEYVHYRRLSEESDQQIATLKADKKRAEKALELACRYHRFDDFKTVRSEIEFFAQQAQEQEAYCDARN